ncbi:hypothetical protein QJS66_04260 [Kocuria rhizophila]|nr:hypothetical protein QJS66_04260 [Kocuria rhizophila]
MPQSTMPPSSPPTAPPPHTPAGRRFPPTAPRPSTTPRCTTTRPATSFPHGDVTGGSAPHG